MYWTSRAAFPFPSPWPSEWTPNDRLVVCSCPSRSYRYLASSSRLLSSEKCFFKKIKGVDLCSSQQKNRGKGSIERVDLNEVVLVNPSFSGNCLFSSFNSFRRLNSIFVGKRRVQERAFWDYTQERKGNRHWSRLWSFRRQRKVDWPRGFQLYSPS